MFSKKAFNFTYACNLSKGFNFELLSDFQKMAAPAKYCFKAKKNGVIPRACKWEPYIMSKDKGNIILGDTATHH